MGIRRVVGASLDGSNVRVILGKTEVPALSASYADRLETADLSYMGRQQIDETTQGTYARDDGELKISSVIFRAEFMPRMPLRGGGNIRIPLIIAFSHPELGSDSDLLEACRIVNWAAAVQNSNASLETTLKLKYRQIFWTEQRKTINDLDGGIPRGASAF